MMDETPKPLIGETFHLLQLMAAADVAEAYLCRMLKKRQISLAEWRTMMLISTLPAASLSALARERQIDKSVASRLVARLARRGFVQREQAPCDRRTSRLSLTARGRAVLGRAASEVLALPPCVVDALDESERQQLAHILGRLRLALSPEGSRIIVSAGGDLPEQS